MGSKNSQNAQKALDGANSQPLTDTPSQDAETTVPCKTKHWIAVRVEFEDGALSEIGIKKNLVLNNGQGRQVILGPGAQPDGKYSVGKIMDTTEDCFVCFPDMYDAEILPK